MFLRGPYYAHTSLSEARASSRWCPEGGPFPPFCPAGVLIPTPSSPFLAECTLALTLLAPVLSILPLRRLKSRQTAYALPALILLAAVLVQPVALVLLPVFWLEVLVTADTSAPETTATRLRRSGRFLGLALAAAAGALLPMATGRPHPLALLDSSLDPLLGARWPGNGLWLVVIMALLVFLRPALLLRTRIAAPGLAAGLLWLAGGAHILGNSPLMGASLLRAGLLPAAVALAVAGRAGVPGPGLVRRSLAGGVLVLFLLPLPFPPKPAGILPPARALGRQDRLLAQESLVGFAWSHHAAGALAVRTYADDRELDRGLRRLSRTGHQNRILVLADTLLDWPWLTAAPGPAGPDRFLYRFRAELLPRTLPLFAGPGASPPPVGTCTGLLPDRNWTGAEFSVDFPVENPGHRWLEMRLRGWRPPLSEDEMAGLRVRLNGQLLALDFQQQTYFRWGLPAALVHPGENHLLIQVPTFVPAQILPGSTDRRQLGLDLNTLVLR